MDYVIIKALEDGVNVSSIISDESAPVLNERLDKGEVFLLILDDDYLGIRIRGKAEIDTVHGKVTGESKILFH
jgi:transcription attenuation protein (tryptophan RNA-binding attenuator protein)